MKFHILLEPAEEGGFNVSVPALSGCYTQGDTEGEALENARESIICYLKGIGKLDEIKSKPHALLKEIEVVI